MEKTEIKRLLTIKINNKRIAVEDEKNEVETDLSFVQISDHVANKIIDRAYTMIERCFNTDSIEDIYVFYPTFTGMYKAIEVNFVVSIKSRYTDTHYQTFDFNVFNICDDFEVDSFDWVRYKWEYEEQEEERDGRSNS